MSFTKTKMLRVGLMAFTIAAIALMSVFGPLWVTTARAQGTVQGAVAAPSGACIVQSKTVPPVTVLDENGVGGVGFAQLLSNQAGVGTGAIRLLAVPISTFTVQVVTELNLGSAPAGWSLLSCGLNTSAVVAGGQVATYVVKGQKVCFNLPTGATAAYKTIRVAYFDTTLLRWVTFSKTVVGLTQACHSSFRLLPTTFALFGSNSVK